MRVCAHVRSAETMRDLVREILTANRNGNLRYESRPKPRTNWTLYDAAATQELPDVLRLIEAFTQQAATIFPATPQRGSGRRPIPRHLVARALLTQSFLELANRPAQGATQALKHHEATAFSYKTIERGYSDPIVRQVLDEVFRLTNLPLRGLETTFSIDGSGMTTAAGDHYASARAKQKTADRRTGQTPPATTHRVYNVAVIGTKHKVLASWITNAAPSHSELAAYPAALRQAKTQQPGMTKLLGDALYGNRPQVKLASDLDITPHFLARRTTSLKRMGVDEYVTMLLEMARDPQAWFREYHMRSISETGFSILNDTQRIRKRLDGRKQTESYLKAIVYNLRRLAFLRYLIHLTPLPGPA